MQNLCFCKTILSVNKIKNQKNRNEFQMYITKTKISYSLNYQTLHYCHKQKPILPIESIQLLIIFSSFKKRNQKTKKKKKMETKLEIPNHQKLLSPLSQAKRKPSKTWIPNRAPTNLSNTSVTRSLDSRTSSKERKKKKPTTACPFSIPHS